MVTSQVPWTSDSADERAQAVEAQSLATGSGAAEHTDIRVLEAPPGEKVTAVWPKPLHVLAACGALSLVGGLVLIGLLVAFCLAEPWARPPVRAA